jgi:hypothetical protein
MVRRRRSHHWAHKLEPYALGWRNMFPEEIADNKVIVETNDDFEPISRPFRVNANSKPC